MARQLDSDGTASPLATAVRHAKLLAATTVVGAVAGAGVGMLMPVRYSAETRLAVGSGSDSAYAIAGYPLAARDLAQNYARWVQNNAIDGTWAPSGVTSVGATPVPDSGVILIETQGVDEASAVAGAESIATSLMNAVDAIDENDGAAAALAEYGRLGSDVAGAQAQVSLAESRFGRSAGEANATALAQARGRLAQAQLVQGAQGDKYRRIISDPEAVSQLTVIAPAAPTGVNRSTNLQLGLIGGGGLGLILGFGIAAVRDLRGGGAKRRTDEPEDAAVSASGTSSRADSAPAHHDGGRGERGARTHERTTTTTGTGSSE